MFELKFKSKYDVVDSTYGKKFTYLGVLLEQQEDGSIHLSMPQYIEDIIQSEFGTKEYSMPADQQLFDEDPSAQLLDEPGAKAFHSLVMKLMYMCRRVRGEALLPVLYLSTKIKSPNTSDENKLKRVVGYLKRTRDRRKVITTTKIERVEMLIDASFPSHIPVNLVQNLVSYAVNRINTRRSSGSVSAVCPRIKSTGKKVNYKREFTLSFGDYVECYDPTSRENSTKERTNSCIALHPYGNITGSWHFLNLLTGRRVRRSRWVKMSHMPYVIKEKLDRLTSTSSVEEVRKDEANRASRVEEETKGNINRDEIRRSHRLNGSR